MMLFCRDGRVKHANAKVEMGVVRYISGLERILEKKMVINRFIMIFFIGELNLGDTLQDLEASNSH